jgi:superfamily II DNA/RNA helicase
MTTTFDDLGLPPQLVAPLRKAGIREPFPIQAATIPDALAGRDVLGRAPTGSGKTLAFGLPMLATVDKAKPHRPRALVLSPTRELAEQIRRELAPIAAGRGLRLLAVYGGVGYAPQRSKLQRGVDVLIACPGRLLDLIEQGELTLDQANYVVVDEADRMADMGFVPQVRKILDMTPDRRQTLLFSATLDGDVAELTRRYQRNPVRHEVGGGGHDAGTARHFFWRVEGQSRRPLVADITAGFDSTLVFTRTRRGADRLAHQLSRDGVTAESIHGGRSQRQRDRALRRFTQGSVEVLVATDVAARGIHVDGVDCVIHYDPPEDHKTYLHRSGRTARAGAGGHVISFVQRDQVRDSEQLQREIGVRGGATDPSLDGLFAGDGELLGRRSSRPANQGGPKRKSSGGTGNRRRGHRSRSGGSNRSQRSSKGSASRSRSGAGGGRSHSGNSRKTSGGSSTTKRGGRGSHRRSP